MSIILFYVVYQENTLHKIVPVLYLVHYPLITLHISQYYPQWTRTMLWKSHVIYNLEPLYCIYLFSFFRIWILKWNRTNILTTFAYWPVNCSMWQSLVSNESNSHWLLTKLYIVFRNIIYELLALRVQKFDDEDALFATEIN